MDTILYVTPLLIQGAGLTIIITATSVAIGCVLGLIAGLARLSGNAVFRALGTGYIDFFRGTPLLVQIFLVFFGIPGLITEVQNWAMASWGIEPLIKDPNLPILWAAITACSLNSGAYIGEIFRAGVQSIERGQMEAARSLGMSHWQAMQYVILPQAFKRIIPPLGNEFIAMLKDTALLSAIGVEELARKGQLLNADMFAPFEIWISVAFLYLLMTLTFSRLVDALERRLRTGDRG
ncbi:MAG: amino acid ABC transporter permease [Peptococcaceae bacterium]|nr:amino acid ABC transporter permease [Peptococcaceae bacterium]